MTRGPWRDDEGPQWGRHKASQESKKIPVLNLASEHLFKRTFYLKEEAGALRRGLHVSGKGTLPITHKPGERESLSDQQVVLSAEDTGKPDGEGGAGEGQVMGGGEPACRQASH